jgi:hypothetical protein
MVAFMVTVGGLSYTGRAEVPCPIGGSQAATSRLCSLDTVPAVGSECPTDPGGIFAGPPTCKKLTDTAFVWQNDFFCKDTAPNPAVPAAIGTKCVDAYGADGKQLTASCIDTYPCVMGTVILWSITTPNLFPPPATVTTVLRSTQECIISAAATTEKAPLKITIPCIIALESTND